MLYADSHEMFAAVGEAQKAKLRAAFPGMTDNGIRNYLWRRRDWLPAKRDKYKCSCQKLHVRECPNTRS